MIVYARSFVKDEEDCDDIVQSAFLKLWERKNFDYAKRFLLTVIRNDCINYINRKKDVISIMDDKDSVDNDEANKKCIQNFGSFVSSMGYSDAREVYSDLIGIIINQINKMSPSKKRIALLMFNDGLTVNEINYFFNIPIGTIRVLKMNAVNKIKEALKGEYEIKKRKINAAEGHRIWRKELRNFKLT